MSLIIRQKRGALQLSINAIVVLILAITMLGLGLNFMNKMFGGNLQALEDVSGEMEKNMRDRLKDSSNDLELSKDEIEIKAPAEEIIYFGARNVDTQEENYAFNITCDESVYDGSTDIANNPKVVPDYDIPGSDSVVLPIIIEATSSDKGHMFPCRLLAEADSGDINNTATFFIIVK
ncbi:hypothetical protein C0585_04695 [Candidatus Woesearchaeota archaeon]|nr:MAG: hypothetical protein C0585_04695 [Candidatus Woesearchaeota archaeon]